MPTDRHSYVEFYPSDWEGGTARLTMAQEWTLHQICLYNWQYVEPMPEKKLGFFLSRNPDWEADLDYLINVAEKLHKTNGGGVFKDRALAAGKKAFDLWEKRSRGGKSTAGKPKQKQKDAKESVKSAGANQNQNQNQNQSKPNGLQPPTPLGENGDLIFSVDPEVWEEWVAHYEKKTKDSMTENVKNRTLKKLERWKLKGHDPTEIIHKSIDNGWRGIFEPKGENGNGNGNRKDGWGNALDEAGGS